MQEGQSLCSSTMVAWFFVLSLSFSTIANTALADLQTPSISDEKAYIVYTEELQGQDTKDHAIELLTSVLGSQKAANEALGYVYKNIGGFSARLNPEQASRLEKQPGFIGLHEGREYYLDPPNGGHKLKDARHGKADGVS